LAALVVGVACAALGTGLGTGLPPVHAMPAPIDDTPPEDPSGPIIEDDTRPDVVVDSITAPVRNIRLVKGRSVSLPVMVRGTFPTDSEVVTWQSSNAHIEVTPPNTVMEGPSDGSFRAPLNRESVIRIAGDSLGSSTLTLAAPGGANVSVKVRVVTTSVKVKSVTITKKKAKLSPGAVAVLAAKPGPATATGVIVRWESSRKKVATVDADGRLVARGTGKTVVTASAGTKKARFTVTVK
jgi:hypothetical protein